MNLLIKIFHKIQDCIPTCWILKRRFLPSCSPRVPGSCHCFLCTSPGPPLLWLLRASLDSHCKPGLNFNEVSKKLACFFARVYMLIVWPRSRQTTEFWHILCIFQNLPETWMLLNQSNQTLTLSLCKSDFSPFSFKPELLKLCSNIWPTNNLSIWPFYFPHHVTQDHHLALWHSKIQLWFLWLVLLMSEVIFNFKKTKTKN